MNSIYLEDKNKFIDIKDIKDIPSNNKCIDCLSNDVNFVNLIFSVFICSFCSKRHKAYFMFFKNYILPIEGVSISGVEKEFLKMGGNAKFNSLLEYYNIDKNTSDLGVRYLNIATLYHIKVILQTLNNAKFIENKPDKKQGKSRIYLKDLEKEISSLCPDYLVAKQTTL